MTKHLSELLLEGIQAWARIGQDHVLLLRHQQLDTALKFVESTSEAKYIENGLRLLFKDHNWAGSAAVKERVFQLLGEAQFWLLATEKGVTLERIPEGLSRVPDFRLKSADSQAPCFEVKTFSVVGGTEAIKQMDENRFEGALDLHRQVASGKKVAMNAQIISPHGDVLWGQEQTTMCLNLIKKAENNIKEEQFTAAPTFLVANLLLIDSHFTGNMELRPLATGWPHDYSEHTGVLWTVGFGQIDQEIRGEPHFEGHPNVEGVLGRQGILVNPQFESVAGVLYMLHPLREASRLYGLWKGARFEEWRQAKLELCTTLENLVGNDWNDENDSNGANLTSA